MTTQQRRTLTAALGIGSIAFGGAAMVAPRLFGRLLGIEAVERPQVAGVLRSVGARDLTVGYDLVSAATSGRWRRGYWRATAPHVPRRDLGPLGISYPSLTA